MRDQRSDDLTEQLLKLEKEGWQALADGDGAELYQQALADNALMVFPFGVLTREESIAAMKAAPQ